MITIPCKCSSSSQPVSQYLCASVHYYISCVMSPYACFAMHVLMNEAGLAVLCLIKLQLYMYQHIHVV